VTLTAIRLELDAVLKVDAGAVPRSSWEITTGPSGLAVAFRLFVVGPGGHCVDGGGGARHGSHRGDEHAPAAGTIVADPRSWGSPATTSSWYGSIRSTTSTAPASNACRLQRIFGADGDHPVQLIDVVYGKRARGGAGVRAQLPRGVLLPSHDGDTIFHVYRCEAWSGYTRRMEVSTLPVRDGIVAIRPWLHLRWYGSGLELFREPSAPGWKRSSPVLVHAEAWVRVLWNEHRGDHEGRWSGDVTINVGMFADVPRPSIFCGEPSETIDLRHDLLRKSRR